MEIKDLMEFAESEPLALGVEEVRGDLPCLPAFHLSRMAHRWPRCFLEWPCAPSTASQLGKAVQDTF